MLQLQSSSVRVSDAAFWHPPLAFTCFTHDIDLREIFQCAHLKFTVSGQSIASRIHTHMRNAVTLVWGSLRLTLIGYSSIYKACIRPALNGSSAIWRFKHSHAIEICNGISFHFYTGLFTYALGGFGSSLLSDSVMNLRKIAIIAAAVLTGERKLY